MRKFAAALVALVSILFTAPVHAQQIVKLPDPLTSIQRIEPNSPRQEPFPEGDPSLRSLPNPLPTPNITELRDLAPGRVAVALPDGGAIVGGEFTSVGGTHNKQYIYRMRPDGSVDPTWTANANSFVTTLALSGNDLYVGGFFNAINGQSRRGLARLNVLDGSVQAWNPNAGNNSSFQLNDIEAVGNSIYVAGRFTQIGTQLRSNLAKINGADGALDNAFTAIADGNVSSLHSDGTSLWLGGSFTQINSSNRRAAAKLNAVTGALDAAWNPGFNDEITNIVLDSGFYYAVGCFNSVNGTSRNFLARVSNSGTGTLDSTWNPTPNGCTYGLAVTASQVYVGGFFTQIGTQSARGVARVSKIGSGAPDPTWSPTPDGRYTLNIFSRASGDVLIFGDHVLVDGVYSPGTARITNTGSTVISDLYGERAGSVLTSLTLSDESVLLGGQFIRAGSVQRRGLLKLDPSGQIDSSFNVSVTGEVWALRQDASHIYVGGYFISPKTNLMRMTSSGTIDTSWTVTPNFYVYDLQIDPSTDSILIGGGFNGVNNVARGGLAEISRTNASLAPWNPNTNGAVYSVALLGSNSVVFGGTFSAVGGVARTNLAKVGRAGIGVLDPFVANALGDRVARVFPGPNDTLYVGGVFNSISGVGRPSFARLLASGAIDPTWNTFLQSGTIWRIVPAPNGIYLGGFFQSIGGVARTNVARVDHNGNVDPLFAPLLNSGVYAIAPVSNRITLGGFFSTAGNANRAGVAAFPIDATPATTTLTITSDSPENSIANQFYLVSVALSNSENVLLPAITPIEVTDGRGSLCTAFLTQAGVGSCELQSRVTGTRTLTATFAGATLFSPSSDTEPHTVVATNPNPPVNTQIELRSVGAVRDSVTLADGSVVVVGDFNRIGTTPRRGIAKFLPDGSLDSAFNVPVLGSVSSIAADSAGNLYVGGGFNYIGSTYRARLAKLDANGNVIAGWLPNWPNNEVGVCGDLAVDAAGNLLVPGCSFFISATPSFYRGRVFKMAASDGAAVAGYQPITFSTLDTNIFPSLSKVAFHNGQIYVAGTFPRINDQSVANLARFDANGLLDTSWAPNPNNRVSQLEFQNSGDLFVSGNFNNIAGQEINNNRLVKLDQNGAIVAAFSPVNIFSAQSIALGTDGLFITGGSQSGSLVFKLDVNSGAVISDFAPQSQFPSYLALTPSELIMGGFFAEANGQERIGYVRVNRSSGQLIATPNATRQPVIYALARQPDGATLLGGSFVRPGSTMRNLVRVSISGALDMAFNPRPESFVSAIAVASDGSIYTNGMFPIASPLPASTLVKLLPNGARDANFVVQRTSLSIAESLLITPDGLITTGRFTTLNGQTRNRIAKVNLTTGALVASFDPNANNSVDSIASDSSGNLYIGGSFTTVGGTPRNRVAKLLPSGALDTAWQMDANSSVRSVMVSSDQKLYVGGFFSQLSGQQRGGLARVSTANPAVLDLWNPVGTRSNSIFALAQGPNSEIYAGGSFSNIGGLYRSNAVKLSPVTGAADPDWNPSFDGVVYAILPGYGSTRVAARNAAVEQDIAFGGEFEFSGSVESPGFSAINSAPAVNEAIFCSGFEDALCQR